ncbi:hypothetical protein B5M45_13060 [Mycobacterium simiae]|uniref:Apea-like HEPN domain-containing protein n=1 Tax=Mycobacterium simiae TaxID=1784 RepID=A0A1X0Y7T9_MYCSI|nr:hypothetical protein B5M45_13060 [Mycobacterium simiae]
MRTPQAGGGYAISRAPETGEVVILGSLTARPTEVSVWRAVTTGRNAVGFPMASAGRPSTQVLDGLWCVAGGHFADSASKWFGVRPDVTNLSEWAWLPSIKESIFLGPGLDRRLRWDLDLPDGLDEVLPDGEGYIMLDPAASISPTTIRGIDVTTRSELEVELFQGWTLEDSFERLALPLADFMTLLSGARCVLRSLDVWSGRWCSVHGQHIDPNGPESAGEMLLRQEQAGLDVLARWLALHRKTTPVPQILAAATGGEFQTVEAEALSLATAVEALHRVLEPKARRFSTDEIDASLNALGKSTVPGAVRETLESALRQYWYEYTYPKRVKTLAEPVASVVPDCIGRINQWKNAVVEQRISLAHGKRAGGMGDDEIFRMISLNRSIRWMLVLRLLLLVGIPPEELTRALGRSRRFINDRDLWRAHWPKVYG